jgi:hypothetical protein
MNPHGHWFTAKLVLGIALGLFAVGVTAVSFLPRSRIQVRTLSPTIRVISAKLLTSTNDSFYLGNQLEGRLRDFLRTRFHLRIRPLPNVPYDARRIHQTSGF